MCSAHCDELSQKAEDAESCAICVEFHSHGFWGQGGSLIFCFFIVFIVIRASAGQCSDADIYKDTDLSVSVSRQKETE